MIKDIDYTNEDYFEDYHMSVLDLKLFLNSLPDDAKLEMFTTNEYDCEAVTSLSFLSYDKRERVLKIRTGK